CGCVYDLSDDLGAERAWVQRLARRLAEQRSHERGAARAETFAAAAEFTAPSMPAPRTPSPAQLNHLAGMRLRAHPARWQGVDATTRRAIMRRTAHGPVGEDGASAPSPPRPRPDRRAVASRRCEGGPRWWPVSIAPAWARSRDRSPSGR